MIHRYDGTITHLFGGLKSWTCTCGANGAVRYNTVSKAKTDYVMHQRIAALHDCHLCDATTSEPYRHPSYELDVCMDCYIDALPKAELMEDL
jgi:hypothetical protein